MGKIISETIDVPYHDFSGLLALVPPPPGYVDIPVFEIDYSSTNTGLEYLLMRFIMGLELHGTESAGKMLSHGDCEDPDIAAWLLACAHILGYHRHTIVRMTQPNFWLAYDPTRPDDSEVISFISAAIAGFAPKFNKDYGAISLEWSKQSCVHLLEFAKHVHYEYDNIMSMLKKIPRVKEMLDSPNPLPQVEFGITKYGRVTYIRVCI